MREAKKRVVVAAVESERGSGSFGRRRRVENEMAMEAMVDMVVRVVLGRDGVCGEGRVEEAQTKVEVGLRRERERGLREKDLGFEDGGVKRRRAWELVRREAIF